MDALQAPRPLHKYSGVSIIHEDNQKLLQQIEADKALILPKKLYAQLTHELRQTRANVASADKLMTAYDTLERFTALYVLEKETARKELDEMNRLAPTADPVSLQTMRLRAKQLQKRLATKFAYITEARQKLAPHVPTLKRVLRDRQRIADIETKLESHRLALEEEAKDRELLKLMSDEAQIVAEQITRTLSRCGFSNSYTVGDKTYTDYVEFAEIVTTPDQHQLKIMASITGIGGGKARDLLPQGVRVTDILQDWVMKELSITLEREVWSPHVGENDVNLINGAWLIVERLGLYDGIPKNVTYSQIMARYDTANHAQLPLPCGLKRGRRINWIEMLSPQATHIMYTGITGSGKTTAIQAQLTALIERQSPKDVAIVLIDLKDQGDFKEIATAPHIIDSNGKAILKDMQDVVDMLKRLQSELRWRQQRIGLIAKNITAYNQRVPEDHRLPHIVILFDEYANTRRFRAEASVIDDICIEITQLGRASGIHLWIGIQQPRRDNMPPALRDNFTTIFVGHQASLGAGQSVTGNRQSLRLSDIPGRMLCTTGHKTYEVQMPYITEENILEAIATSKKRHAGILPYGLQIAPTNEGDTPKTLQEHGILTDIELLAKTALEEYEGKLLIYPLHDALKDKLSRPKIQKTIAQMAEMATITYNGIEWSVIKDGRNFALENRIAMRTCFYCRKTGTDFCTTCQSRLSSIEVESIARKIDNYRSVFSTTRATNNLMRRSLAHVKYENLPVLANMLGVRLGTLAQRHGIEADYIIPVPLSEERQKERGYNQSYLYALELSNMVNIPVLEHGLLKTKHTQSQIDLTADERLINVADAFALNCDVQGKSIIVIDDTLTTGATLKECGKVLLEGGASELHAITIATAKK